MAREVTKGKGWPYKYRCRIETTEHYSYHLRRPHTRKRPVWRFVLEVYWTHWEDAEYGIGGGRGLWRDSREQAEADGNALLDQLAETHQDYI